MTVQDTIQRPNLSPVVLAEITAGIAIGNWIASSTSVVVGVFADTTLFSADTTLLSADNHASVSSGSGSAYQAAMEQEIVSVAASGTLLDQKPDLVSVQNGSNGWFWDRSSATLYTSGSVFGNSLFDHTVIASARFRFSTKPKIFNDAFYEARLKSAPNISLRIEEGFSGVGQIGGGQVTLINNDGFFDAISDISWNNGNVKLLFGADALNEDMAYADYVNLATWVIEDWSKTDETFLLRLREIKSKVDKKVPLNVFTFEQFPTIKPQDIGKPIPLAYGRVLGAQPILIDAGSRKFQVADHPIRSIDQARIQIDESWRVASVTSVNTALAQFTLGAEFTGNESVSVDFHGKVDSSGTNLIENAADIVKDLLATVGETNVNVAAFATAKARLEPATELNGEPVVIRTPSFYIAQSTDLFRIIEQINKEVGSYLYVDGNGQYVYGVWQPQPGESLPIFDQLDWLDFSEQRTNGEIVSRVHASYAERRQDEFVQLVIEEKDANRLIGGYNSALVKDETLSFTEFDDTQYWAQRQLIMQGRGSKIWNVSVPWRGWLLTPGSQVHIVYDRHKLDAIAEVYEISYDLIGGKANLRLGNLRGFGDTPGWWVRDSEWVLSFKPDPKIQTVQIASNPTIEFDTGSFTIEGWFYHRSYTASAAGACMSKGDPSASAAGWSIGEASTGSTFKVEISDATHYVTSSIALDAGSRPSDWLGKWIHLAVVFDRSASRIKVYVNGVKQANEEDISTVTGSVNNSLSFVLGDAQGWQIDGLVDEFRIWNTARTQAEIQAVMNDAMDGRESGLKVCWRLDDSPLTAVKISPYNSLGESSGTQTNNGGFEAPGAGGSDVFAVWSETIDGGTSTINRDTTVTFNGAASCRFDIDASNNGCYIQQSNLSAGKYYRTDFVAMTSDGAGGPHLRLDSYGTFALTDSWTGYSQDFIATGTDLRLRSHQAASRSLWIDDVQVIELQPVAINSAGPFMVEVSGSIIPITNTGTFNPIVTISGTGSLTSFGPLWTKSESPLNDRLPTRFAGLAGYGTGSLIWNRDWAPEIKAWARQNVGYWSDEHGFADPSDSESHLASVWV